MQGELLYLNDQITILIPLRSSCRANSYFDSEFYRSSRIRF